MAARRSPKPLVKVRVLGGVPKFTFVTDCLIRYNSLLRQTKTMNPLSSISSPVILIGAYGRDYFSEIPVLEDWHAGKDFKIVGGPYCSVRDIEQLKARGRVYIRYGIMPQLVEV